MRILIICQPRTGSTVFSKWLSKELNFQWINEPFNRENPDSKKEIHDSFHNDNIVAKLIYEIGRGEWFYDKKIYDIRHLFSLNWDHIFILTRDDVSDQAISNAWAGINRKWHVNYQLNDSWINQNKRIIEKYLNQLEIDKKFLKSIKHQQITYEGIYQNKTDIEKICHILNIENLKYVSDLSNKNRYRGSKLEKNTKLI